MAPGSEGSDPFWNHAGVLHQAGVPFALAGGKLLDKARFAIRYGLPPAVALDAITSQPAAIMGVSDRVGSIKPGLDADLVAFDGEPMELTTNILWTAVAGTLFDTSKQGKK
jgi:imidazolonepropionase-like amidohydrolase